tara:strand:- start:8011 stop:9426 length:1416 start_codon:yes stop_codon:yes gene_type:complete
MTFKRDIPINVTGPSYQSRSAPLASQQTKNFYQQIVEEGVDQFVLHSWFGLKTISTVVTGAERGSTKMAGIGYRVAGTTLYSFDTAGVHTSIGTISGTARCIMSNDGFNLVIVVPGGTIYMYDGTTLSIITDTNITGSIAVTYLNSQMIYTNPPLFVVADAGIPNLASGLNAASADSQPDELLHAYAFKQNINMIGKGSIEPWWNTGEGNPPIARLDGQLMETGCAATYSIAHTDEAMYWLGDDLSVWRTSGGAKEKASSVAISHAIEGYATVSDAIGYTVSKEGQNFYILTFPAANKTWALSEDLGNKGWFELSSGTNGGKYQATSMTEVYGQCWAFDENGSYQLDIDTFSNGGETIQRRRTMGVISGKPFGKRGSSVQLSKIKLLMETGVGLIAGQGENPQIILEMSYDGCRSWKDYGFARIGRMGDFTIQVEFDILDTFREGIPRITTSDPVPYSIYSATIDLRLAGR